MHHVVLHTCSSWIALQPSAEINACTAQVNTDAADDTTAHPAAKAARAPVLCRVSVCTCPELASSSWGCCCAAAASGAGPAVAVTPRGPQPTPQHPGLPTTPAPSACMRHKAAHTRHSLVVHVWWVTRALHGDWTQQHAKLTLDAEFQSRPLSATTYRHRRRNAGCTVADDVACICTPLLMRCSPVGAAQGWCVCHVAHTGVHKVARQLHVSALASTQHRVAGAVAHGQGCAVGMMKGR